jgi:N-acetylglutamate synthase-like GNAT family acetyltransferase
LASRADILGGVVLRGEILVRFAAPDDLDFLQQHSHVPAKIVKRKVEWQEIVVAESLGRSIGSLHLEYLWSLVPYIALIYVQPKYRRQGVGRAMLRFVETLIREQGQSALYSSSQVDEPEPQAWHRHVGFEECGVIAGINKGVGEVFFRKRL